MNPQNPIPTPQRIHNPLEVIQPDEQIICEIKRHPAGIIGMYLIASVIIIIFAVFCLAILPDIFSANRGSATAIGTAVFLLATCIVIGLVFIANKIYWGNSWVVSSDSLTQISQTSLFHKQTSQLSLGNLEDVSSEQSGIWAQLLRFGTLKAETAGERSKFVFPYCPNPNSYAQKILAAREAFEQAHHGGKQEPYKAVSTNSVPEFPEPQPQNQSQSPPQSQVQPTAPPAPTFPDTPYDSQSQQNNPPSQ
jgi:hypothetical protein